jgi:prepilin-type N-terminal cleavage/methylation domain-containing protein
MSHIIDQKASSQQGFTLMDLIIALSILGILCSIAIPAYSSWLPDYELKNAVRDLYSNMHLAKMLSIKENKKYEIVFETNGTGSYRLVRPDGTTLKNVQFADYDRIGGIGYGRGKATKSAKDGGGPIPADGVSYQNNKIFFNPRGIASGMGYVYLGNQKGIAYALGTWIAGIIVVKKWSESKGKWE